MKENLLRSKKGLIFVVSAPAGTGKTTLVQKLVNQFPEIVASVSYTTRSPREEEIPGVHYHFITEAEFKAKIAASEFLEYVTLYGAFYGTSRKWIEEQQKLGKHVVLVIDTQGALKLRGKIPAAFIFIRPPSLESLKTRLLDRKTETAEKIEQRLKWAEIELEAAQQYDYEIINDDLETAYEILKSIFIAECHKVVNLKMGDKKWKKN